MLILEDELFVELSTTSSMIEAFSVCRVLPWCLLHIVEQKKVRTINLQFSHMFFDVVPFLQIEKIFRTLFAVFTPSRPCANDDTLKFFFTKMFHFFFRRIKMLAIIGSVTFERFLCIVKFIFQYVLLIFFFSFALRLALRFENCTTACALSLY